MEIWKKCKGSEHIKKIECCVWRIVENQYVNSTRKLVDDGSEHDLLEDLIESHKPENSYAGYHYLLYTPFRYPPLEYGSRFGDKNERALWYGSLDFVTALAEKAFYRFHFLLASDAEYEELPIKYSSFQAEIKTSRSIDLTQLPFKKYVQHISNPSCYIASQKLGKAMRNADVDAFLYQSARCSQKGNNVGLFSPHAFQQKTPVNTPFETWEATVINSKSQIEFIRTNGLHAGRKQFYIHDFWVDGKLPKLAS